MYQMMAAFKYIDIHTHLNLAAFKDDWREVIARAHEAGVALVNVGTQHDTAQRAVAIAREYEHGVYATIGLHPVHTSKSYHDPQEFTDVEKGFTSRGEQFDAATYKEMANDTNVVAVGECGLDYYRMEPETKGRQTEAFIEQIALANTLNKPLMLHIRSGEGGNAYRDAYEIIKTHARVRGNLHFFAGSYEDAKLFWDMGYSTSFTGVITFARNYDEVVRSAPINLIHAETDAPYVTPVPHRGTRNEPLRVIEVVRRIAEIRGEEAESVRIQLLKNAEKLFSINL
jgi:TatD DNase family protein